MWFQMGDVFGLLPLAMVALKEVQGLLKAVYFSLSSAGAQATCFIIS